MSASENNELYTPDGEEINDALVFLSACSSEDLCNGWTKISSEWDIDSITHVHRMLCKSGRINVLLEQLSSA